jgi:hypothetical protein
MMNNLADKHICTSQRCSCIWRSLYPASSWTGAHVHENKLVVHIRKVMYMEQGSQTPLPPLSHFP